MFITSADESINRKGITGVKANSSCDHLVSQSKGKMAKFPLKNKVTCGVRGHYGTAFS